MVHRNDAGMGPGGTATKYFKAERLVRVLRKRRPERKGKPGTEVHTCNPSYSAG